MSDGPSFPTMRTLVDLLRQPQAPTGVELPPGGKPNRPIGEDYFGDMVEGILSVLGIKDPLDPAASKATQIGGIVGAGVPLAAGAKGLKSAVTAAKPTRTIKAYHGSPHDFEKFSLEKFGTGEGGGAYGHGLYFAEEEKVANEYRKRLSRHAERRVEGGGKIPDWVADDLKEAGNPPQGSQAFNAIVDKAITDFEARLASAQKRGASEFIPTFKEALTGLKNAKAGRKLEPRGRSYEVEMKADPEDFIDWDKPLSEQSEKVKAAAKRLGIDLDETSSTGQHLWEETVRRHRKPSPFPEITIRDPKQAAEKFREAGVPGIRYLDKFSREAGEGSRNTVVFDDSIIDILRKYGLLLPAGIGGAGAALLSELEGRPEQK